MIPFFHVCLNMYFIQVTLRKWKDKLYSCGGDKEFPTGNNVCFSLNQEGQTYVGREDAITEQDIGMEFGIFILFFRYPNM